MFPWKKHLLIVWIHYSADKSSAWLYCWCYCMSPYLPLWRLLSSAGSGPLRIQTLGRVPQSVINEGGDRQAGCILITHKDKEWYGENERTQGSKEKKGEWSWRYTLCDMMSLLVLRLNSLSSQQWASPICGHTQEHKHTQALWILTWPQKQTEGHERRRRSLLGLAESSGSGEIGPSSRTLQYPQGPSLMTFHASEPGSQNEVTELCSYCRPSWNYLCKCESEPVNTNGDW